VEVHGVGSDRGRCREHGEHEHHDLVSHLFSSKNSLGTSRGKD
jgi:hypothetical protein